MRALFAPLAAGLLLLALAAALSFKLAATVRSRPYDVLHVPSGKVMRVAALGHRTFLSDLYWLDTVQYIGEPRADARGWDKLLPLVDLVTDLDPRHGYAYQTAGIVLSAAGRLDESNRILAKGMELGPDWWSFPYYLSFNSWFYMGDYATGAYYAGIAARRPGASPNISHLALSLSSKSGTPEQAITLLTELRATVKDEATAERLDEQLKLATLEADAQGLEAAVERFRERHGRDPFGLEELIVGGAITSMPTDPFGGAYVWDPKDRRVHSTANPFRFTLREAARAPAFHYQPSQRDLARMPK
ncbi:MAG: tetratricopeptide repeat protein [Anaeromyxobacter sp.]